MPSASLLPAFRLRPRLSWPLGLLLAMVALASEPIVPGHAFARMKQASASFQAASPQVAPWLLWAALGGLALRWQMGQRRRRIEEGLRGRLAERERIARELHDNLLQGAISLVLRVDASMQDLPADHATRRQIESALAYADGVLQRTREQVLLLRGHPVRGELAHAIEEAVDQRHPGGEPGVVVKIMAVGTPRPLDETCWAELHGIGLEAMTNALRHARAAQVTLVLEYHPDALVLGVRDDGVGIAMDTLRGGGRPGHCGLRCMRERARMLNARLDIRAPATGGTVVLVRVAARVAYQGRLRTLQRPSRSVQD